MSKSKGFQRTIDGWMDDADGKEDDLVDVIVLWVQDADESDIDEMARYMAKQLLADNDNDNDNSEEE